MRATVRGYFDKWSKDPEEHAAMSAICRESQQRIMSQPQHLVIIGSGPSCLYLLYELTKFQGKEGLLPEQISIFEKGSLTGVGMPFSPETTDRYNMSNISSEEIPELPDTLEEWLKAQPASLLAKWGIKSADISDDEVYTRLALGAYFSAQFAQTVAQLKELNVVIAERTDVEVLDVRYDATNGTISLLTNTQETVVCDRLVIASGHSWPHKDAPARGYYASPWPIKKLLPGEDEYHNFPIGTLGASLSAFDVVVSLAERHGRFSRSREGAISFQGDAGAEEFKIVMHSAEGTLPHLQYAQVHPFREVYRHVTKEDLWELIDKNGRLSLRIYFDEVCRPALITAFSKDGRGDMVDKLRDPQFIIKDFVNTMSAEHEYDDAFQGMEEELSEAIVAVQAEKPVQWKEVLDDLMYTLNFHAELMTAEDHVTLQSELMPFVLNVVAAMPLESAAVMLALHRAGRLQLVSGDVTLQDPPASDQTVITVEDEGEQREVAYRMFVDCSGQKPINREKFPFRGLAEKGCIRDTQAVFTSEDNPTENLPESFRERVTECGDQWFLDLGGVEIDAQYRLIKDDGSPLTSIYDISFPHIYGYRPYNYGLQAVQETCVQLVAGWVKSASGSSLGITNPG